MKLDNDGAVQSGEFSLLINRRHDAEGEMMEYTSFWENDTLMYMLAGVLALPAGWIAMKVLDWWDSR